MHEDINIYKTLIESVPMAILVEDDNRNITLANQTFCNLFEIPFNPNQIVDYDSLELANNVKHLMLIPTYL